AWATGPRMHTDGLSGIACNRSPLAAPGGRPGGGPSERPAGRAEVALGLKQATQLALPTLYAVVHRVRYPACTMRLLLVTPPMIQLNTPYPATAYLMGFLRLHAADLGLELTQADASLTLFLRLFSGPLVARAADVLAQRVRTAGKRGPVPPSIAHFLKHAKLYVDTVGPAIRFLQRRDPSLAFRIVGRAFLPEGPRFEHLSPPPSGEHAAFDEQLLSAFGTLGTTEQA